MVFSGGGHDFNVNYMIVYGRMIFVIILSNSSLVNKDWRGVGECTKWRENGAERKSKKALLGTNHRDINLNPHSRFQMQILHPAPCRKANFNLPKSQCVYATPNWQEHLILHTVCLWMSACINMHTNKWRANLSAHTFYVLHLGVRTKTIPSFAREEKNNKKPQKNSKSVLRQS